ncbi:MAG TPA: nucleoside triphosphate pyrophosphatase [Acidimicrobiales bacterium]|nr:nucleoside triphosphate pyrophosphatase [Acidimicrobiales bacterium]
MTRVILASASPARRRLLAQAGIDAQVIVSGVDEEAVSAPDARELVRTLAEQKAAAVAADAPAGCVVIGCDSMLDLDGEVLGKPLDVAEATDRWKRMRGRSGTLFTGHCVIDTTTGARAVEVAATIVRFGSPTDNEIEAYARTGEPLGVAGAFTIDGRSALFVDGIDGDHTNVIGLSLPLLRSMLRALDIEVTSLWS